MTTINQDNMTPLKAIKQHCKECSGFILYEQKHCIITRCPLHPYRMGNNPKRKGLGGKGNTDGLKAYREAKQAVS